MKRLFILLEQNQGGAAYDNGDGITRCKTLCLERQEAWDLARQLAVEHLNSRGGVLIEDEEIESVKLESKKTLELTQFVDHHEIDVLYFERPYYVVPADDLAEEAFIVLREALRRTKKVALGQLALRSARRPFDKRWLVRMHYR